MKIVGQRANGLKAAARSSFHVLDTTLKRQYCNSGAYSISRADFTFNILTPFVAPTVGPYASRGDLENIFGIRQSGDMEFKMGDIFTDASILKAASDAVKKLKDIEVENIFEDNPYLEEKLLNRSNNTL